MSDERMVAKIAAAERDLVSLREAIDRAAQAVPETASTVGNFAGTLGTMGVMADRLEKRWGSTGLGPWHILAMAVMMLSERPAPPALSIGGIE